MTKLCIQTAYKPPGYHQKICVHNKKNVKQISTVKFLGKTHAVSQPIFPPTPSSYGTSGKFYHPTQCPLPTYHQQICVHKKTLCRSLYCEHSGQYPHSWPGLSTLVMLVNAPRMGIKPGFATIAIFSSFQPLFDTFEPKCTPSQHFKPD